MWKGFCLCNCIQRRRNVFWILHWPNKRTPALESSPEQRTLTSEYPAHLTVDEGTETWGEAVHTCVLSLLPIHSSTFLQLPSTGRAVTLFFLKPMDAPYVTRVTSWSATISLAAQTSLSPGFPALSKAACSHFLWTFMRRFYCSAFVNVFEFRRIQLMNFFSCYHSL